MQILYRHGRPQDFLRAGKVLEGDRPLFSPNIWQLLPKLIEDLLNRERIRVCVYEDRDAAYEVVCIGVTAFVDPGFLRGAMESGRGLADSALAAECNGRSVFLNRKQVAEANRSEDLRALTFFGVPAGVDLSDPNTFGALGRIAEGWTFFHKGFGLREIWFEPVSPLMIDTMERVGLPRLRERSLPCGTVAKVFCLTRSEAAPLAPNWPASTMFAPPPRFSFTRAEQRLLELALLDSSDRDAAEEMRVSSDAVKKRWRSIYARISRVEPALLRSDLAGADQRRAVLQILRDNLQELRPY